MSKIVLILGVVVVVLGAAFFFLQPKNEEQPVGEVMEEVGEMVEEEHSMMTEHSVVYSDGGYAPEELTIKKGDKVTFRNESARETWPASAMHPSHSVYPGSSIQKCETEEMTRIFDACVGLKQGEEWSFVFEEPGEWFYHDHLRPDMFGKIMVQK